LCKTEDKGEPRAEKLTQCCRGSGRCVTRSPHHSHKHHRNGSTTLPHARQPRAQQPRSRTTAPRTTASRTKTPRTTADRSAGTLRDVGARGLPAAGPALLRRMAMADLPPAREGAATLGRAPPRAELGGRGRRGASEAPAPDNPSTKRTADNAELWLHPLHPLHPSLPHTHRSTLNQSHGLGCPCFPACAVCYTR
jgi:hypothetical protein